MPEWSIGPHSKCGVRATVPGVRIPLFPQVDFGQGKHRKLFCDVFLCPSLVELAQERDSGIKKICIAWMFALKEYACRDARGREWDHGAKRRNPLFASPRAAGEGSLSNISCEKIPLQGCPFLLPLLHHKLTHKLLTHELHRTYYWRRHLSNYRTIPPHCYKSRIPLRHQMLVDVCPSRHSFCRRIIVGQFLYLVNAFRRGCLFVVLEHLRTIWTKKTRRKRLVS